ncbi:MAG: hypothetical protein ABEJ91_01870 [Candidatus Nanohaloarchaea archaeon]
MGFFAKIFADYSKEKAKEIHRGYNRFMYSLDDTRTGEVLNEFGIETDPFKEDKL